MINSVRTPVVRGSIRSYIITLYVQLAHPLPVYINPRRLRVIVMVSRLRRFSRDCSGAVCDEELKLGMTDTPFKPDMTNYFHFQIRSGH